MFPLAQGREGDGQSHTATEAMTRSQSSPAGGASLEARGALKGPSKDRPSRDSHSLATVTWDQGCLTQQVL